MADTFTSNLGLLLPDLNDAYNFSSQVEANFTTIDALMGLVKCTTSTRPSNTYGGQGIYETDTGRVAVNTGTKVSPTWTYVTSVAISCTSGARPSVGLLAGLMAYETDTHRTIVYNGSAWQQVGVVTCTASTHPANPLAGGQIYETDTGDSYVYNGSAYTWLGSAAQEWSVASTSGTLSSIATATDTAYAFVSNTASTGVSVSLGTTGTTVGTSGTKVTLTKAGQYDWRVCMRWASATGYFFIAVRRYNSSNVEQERWGTSTTVTSNQATLSLSGRTNAASAGDYLQVWVTQTTGGAVLLASDNTGCRFAGNYVHP